MGVSLCWLLDVVLFTPAFPAQAVYWLSDLRSNRPWTKQGNHHQGNNQLCPSPVTHRVQLHLRCCTALESARQL